MNNEIGTRTGKFECRRTPDPARCPCNDSGSVFQTGEVPHDILSTIRPIRLEQLEFQRTSTNAAFRQSADALPNQRDSVDRNLRHLLHHAELDVERLNFA
jgi:hypothetical protein